MNNGYFPYASSFDVLQATRLQDTSANGFGMSAAFGHRKVKNNSGYNLRDYTHIFYALLSIMLYLRMLSFVITVFVV